MDDARLSFFSSEFSDDEEEGGITALPTCQSFISRVDTVSEESATEEFGSEDDDDDEDEEDDEKDSPRIIEFDEDDPEDPHNWSSGRKTFMGVSGIMSVVNSTFGSSLPSNATEFIALHWQVTNEQQLVLPVSCYLFGYVIGPVLCGPLSESFGRKTIFVYTFMLYTIFSMACAVASSWWSFLFFRFWCGFFASAPIAVVGGMFADIHDNPRVRGVMMALYMAATAVGPVLAPPISGFIAENVTWRWVFAVGTLFAAATMPLILFIPESSAGIILSRRAAKIRKETGENVAAQAEMQDKSLRSIVTVVLARPFKMLFQELIVACVCAYSSLAYAIFYLNFEAYPLIFSGPMSVYKWSPGLAGLPFLAIGVGVVFAAPVFLYWDSRLERARKNKEAWVQQEEYHRLPLAIVGGPLFAISLFWIAWSSKPDVHWIAPILSGIPFGMGFILIFMALLNYLSDAYQIFAASAMGIASLTRSLLGALLPLGARRMYTVLGIDWAGSLLGFVSLAMAIIPFAFIKYGDKIRANSKFCQELREIKQKMAKDSASTKASTRASKRSKTNTQRSEPKVTRGRRMRSDTDEKWRSRESARPYSPDDDSNVNLTRIRIKRPRPAKKHSHLSILHMSSSIRSIDGLRSHDSRDEFRSTRSRHEVRLPRTIQEVSTPKSRQAPPLPKLNHEKKLPRASHEEPVPRPSYEKPLPRASHELPVSRSSHQTSPPTPTREAPIPMARREMPLTKFRQAVPLPQLQQEKPVQRSSYEFSRPRTSNDFALPRFNHEITLPRSSYEAPGPRSNYEVSLPRSSQDVQFPRASQSTTFPRLSHEAPMTRSRIDAPLPPVKHEPTLRRMKHQVWSSDSRV